MTEVLPRPAEARKGLLMSALRYAERGIHVFSVVGEGPGAKLPNISNDRWAEFLGKPVPKGRGGLNMATTDPEIIKWMFSQPRAGGIGMPCGKINNVIVADFDLHKEPDQRGNAHRQMTEHEDVLMECHQVATRTGGRHFYFLYEEGHSKHELGQNIDIQTDGAFVLVPPSPGYKVLHRIDRDDWVTPPWAGVPVKKMTATELASLDEGDLKDLQRKICAGEEWHNNMVRMTAHMVMTGWSDAEILRHARQWTLPGFNHDDTFEEVYVALQGARTKWLAAGKPLDRNERMKRWMMDFEAMDEATRMSAVDWAQRKVAGK